jgi:hypothetical protein
VSRAFAGAAIAGIISFGVFLGIFTLIGRFPADLDKGLALVVVMPLLFIGSLIAGYVSGKVARAAVAVLWTVAAVVMGLVVAAMLRPLDAPGAASTYSIFAVFSVLPAAVGHLIAAAFRTRAIGA